MKEIKDEVLVIQGSGGGSSKKQHTPVEEPNTLRAKVRGKILDLIAYGPIKGLANGLKSVYLEGTPVENADGTKNFEGITITTREGYPDQERIPGFKSVENTIEVNTEIKFNNPVIRSITNNDADAASITIQLAGLYQRQENGDTTQASVRVLADVRKDGGAWMQVLDYNFQGKTTSPYPKTFRIDLKPYGSGSFDIRVHRATPESETSTLSDKMTWTLLSEIIDRRFSHPHMALVGIEVDSELFGSQMPSRVYDMLLSITKVPSNWDPETRVYTGIWDGTFKDAWHDNPAWAYYDLATHPVIGAGLDVIDKWELYRIAKYCDELVPNGYGGMEPRFTINTVFSDQEDATAALNTLASAFRGMTYWGTNTVVPVADMPEEPVLTVGPSSVKDGDFSRVGTSIRERHSVAIVMWNDPDDMGKAIPEIYEDPDSIAEFGWRETRVTAVGCNSRGQARRLAMWILDSERNETQTLSYSGTSEHAFLRPGNIIEVADPYEQGARMSGRLLERSTNRVVLDQVPTEAVAQIGGTWYLSVLLPDMTMSRHQVSSFEGNIVHLVDPLLTLPLVGAIWGLYSAGLQLPQYRVITNQEDTKTGMFNITATEYDPNKYSRVELGLNLPERPISLIPTGPIPAPTNLTFEVYTYYAGTARQQGLLISYEQPKDVRVDSFVIDAKGPSDASYRTVYNGRGTSFDLGNVEAGQWSIRVRSVASTGRLSMWLARTVQVTQLLLPTPPDSVTVTVATFSITLTPVSAYADAMWEFWRSSVALEAAQIEANATQLPTGSYLVDANLKPDTQYFYYVRGVNQYGKSNWFGVQGKTLNDFEDILEAVTKDVTEGQLYQEINQQIDTKATQIAIDKANEVVNEALVEVDQSIAGLNDTVNQVSSALQTGLTDANAAIQGVKTQADGIRADLTSNLATVNGAITGINADVATLKTDAAKLKTDMSAVQGSITTINTTTGGLRTDLTALQGTVTSEVAGLKTTTQGLQAQLDAASSAREYNKANSYTAGQFISVGRSLYQAKIAVPAKADGTNAPPNATYWRDAGSVVASADGLATRVTSAETTIGTINGTLTSQATEISGIKTTLNDKADASALTALTTRVTAAEGVNTSQGTAITNLTNTVAGKADASALTALTTRVTAAEGTLTSQGSAITSLNNSLAGKADASALTALTTRVTNAEGTLTSLSNSMTSVQATLGGIGGVGSNMLPAEYTAFSSTVPPTSTNAAYTVAVEADAAAFNGSALKITANTTANGAMYFVPSGASSIAYAHANMGFKRGKYILSYSAKAAVAGHTIAPFLKTISPDGSSINSSIVSQNQALTTSWARYSHVIDMTSASHVSDLMLLCLQTNVSLTAGRTFWLDKIMIEPMIGENTAPSPFMLGNSFRQALGNAAATTALEARVTAAEGVNTSQATSITNLNSSLAGKADAAALTALTTRVTNAEGVNTSQGDSITSLTNSLGSKADASALTALTTRVTNAEGVNTSQGTAITNLTNSLAGKADASALTALSNTVTQQGATLTAQGSQITTIQTGLNALPQENLVYDPDFTDGRNAFPAVANVTITNVDKTDASAPAGAPSTRLLKFVYAPSSTSNFYQRTAWPVLLRDGSGRLAVQEGEVYDVSFTVFREGTSDRQFGIWVQPYSLEGTSINHGWLPTSATSITAVNGQWVTISGSLTVPATAVNMNITLRASIHADPLTVWVSRPVINRRSVQARNQADATNALTARVTAAEGTITSQSSALTSLTNSLGSKADASALTALTTRVTAAEGVNTSQGTAITNLQNSLPGKADASALTALTTRVTAAEGTIASQSTALTTVQATLGGIGGNGTNLLPAEYCVFGAAAPAMVVGGGITAVTEADATAFSGYALKFQKSSGTATVYLSPSTVFGSANMALKKKKYLVSMYARSDVAGHQFRAGFRAIQADGTVVFHYPSNMTVTTEWARYTTVIDMTASPADKMILCIDAKSGSGTYGAFVWVDKIMVEEQIGTSEEPSAFTIGNSSSQVSGLASAQSALDARVTSAEGTLVNVAQSLTTLSTTLNGKADTSALNALTTRVSAAEGTLTSQGSSITSLTASMNAIGGAGTNLVPAEYSTFSAAKPDVVYAASLSETVTDSEAFNGYALKVTSANTSTSAAIYLSPSPEDYASANIACKQGKYILSYYAKAETAGHTIAVFARTRNAAGSAASSAGAPQDALTTSWQRYSSVVDLTGSGFADKDKMIVGIQINRSGVAGRVIYLDRFMIEPMIGGNTSPSVFVPGNSLRQTAALGTAVQSLDVRLTSAEGVNTSQGTAITNLTSSLAGKADASALTALTTRVTNAENVNTSQASSITNLSTGLGNSSQEDVLLNPTWAAEGTLKTENGSTYQMDYANATDAGVPAGAPAQRLLWRLKKAADSGWGGAVLTSSNKIGNDYQIFSRANAGDVINLSCHMYCENAALNAGKIAITPVDADGNSGGVGNVRILGYVAATGGWQFLTAQYTIPAGYAGFRIYVVPEGVAPIGFKMWIGNLKVTRQNAAEKSLAAADQALDTRVTAAEGTITSQGSAITSLTNSVANKADASALTALTTRVTAAEGSLTSQGSSITSLTNSMNAIGGSGVNLVPAEYGSFTATLPAIQRRGTTTVTAEAYSAAYQTHRLKVSDSTTDGNGYFCLYANNETLNIRLKPSTKYIFSAWAQCGGADRLVRLRHRYVGADGVQVEAHLANVNLTTTWGRVSATFTTPAALVDRAEFLIFTTPNANSQDSWWDGFMVEEQQGNSTAPSSWVAGPAANALALQASATQALDTRLTAAEGVNTSQATAITNLTSSLSGKADASALSALTTRVTNAEGTLTSLGSSVTNINATLGGISGNGANLVPSQYSWLGGTLPQVTLSTATTIVTAADSVAPSGYRYRVDRANGSNPWMMFSPTNNAAGWNITMTAGTYILSYYANGSAAAVANGIKLRSAIWDGGTKSSADFTLTSTRTRYSHLITIPSDTVGAVIIWVPAGVEGDRFWVDSVMLERQIGNGTTPSTFVAGPTASEVTGLANAQSALEARVTSAEGVNTSQATSITNLNTALNSKADASALTALTSRVTSAEGTLTSQGSSITSLGNSLNGVSTDNLIIDPSYAVGNNTNQASATVLQRTSGSVTSVGCPAPRVLSWSIPTSTGNTYMGINAVVNARSPESALAHNMAVAEGETYDFELYVFSSVARQYGLWIQFYDTAGASINHTWAVEGGDGVRLSSTAGAWTKLTGTAVVPAGVIRMAMCLRFSAGDATTAHICAPVCRKRDGQSNATVSAVQSLTTRVTSAEGLITSQGNSITSLTSTVAGKADTSALTALTTRVTAAEGSITSQGSAVTALQTSLGNIGGTGSNLNPSEYSVFGPNAPTIGALSSGLTVSTVADGATLGGYALKFVSSSTSTTLACYLHSSNTVSAVGSFPMSYSNKKYIVSFYAKANVAGRQIRAWLRALNASDAAVGPTAPTFTLTTGWVRYSMVMDLTNATTYSGSRMVFAVQPNTSGVSGTEIYLDRIMVEQQISSGTEPSAFEAGTSYTQAQAQASAISSLDTRVTSAEGVNTSQATSITNLTSRMGSAESSISTTASTLASTNGTLSSMWALKINTAVGGKQYVAGMGASMVTTGGITQSEILFQADRFALINSSSGAITIPFFIENGVTYIQSAMIKTATIINAIIGQEINSAAYTNWGGPVMSINFNVGQIVTRHPTSANTYTVVNQNGMYVVVSGVLRVRMGVW